MEDAIRYIIMIGAVVVWIVSKITKTTKTVNTSTTPPPMSSPGKKNLEDWWKELKDEVQPVPQPVTVQKTKKTAQTAAKQAIDNVNPNYFENLQNNYKNPEFSPRHKSLQHLEVIENSANARSAYKPLKINLKGNDEVRRAFVCSEIFNRKY